MTTLPWRSCRLGGVPMAADCDADWHRQCGHSSTEYVIVCAALATALGLGLGDDSSILWQLLDAFESAYANFSYAISLPQ